MIEEIKNIKSSSRDIRNFGVVMGIALCVVGAYFFYFRGVWYPALFALGVVFMLAGAWFPFVLLPLQKIWMTIGIVLGWCITRVILILFFYVVFTPFACIARWCGNRFLAIRFDRTAESYWRTRSSRERMKQDFEKQF